MLHYASPMTPCTTNDSLLAAEQLPLPLKKGMTKDELDDVEVDQFLEAFVRISYDRDSEREISTRNQLIERMKEMFASCNVLRPSQMFAVPYLEWASRNMVVLHTTAQYLMSCIAEYQAAQISRGVPREHLTPISVHESNVPNNLISCIEVFLEAKSASVDLSTLRHATTTGGNANDDAEEEASRALFHSAFQVAKQKLDYRGAEDEHTLYQQVLAGRHRNVTAALAGCFVREEEHQQQQRAHKRPRSSAASDSAVGSLTPRQQLINSFSADKQSIVDLLQRVVDGSESQATAVQALMGRYSADESDVLFALNESPEFSSLFLQIEQLERMDVEAADDDNGEERADVVGADEATAAADDDDDDDYYDNGDLREESSSDAPNPSPANSGSKTNSRGPPKPFVEHLDAISKIFDELQPHEGRAELVSRIKSSLDLSLRESTIGRYLGRLEGDLKARWMSLGGKRRRGSHGVIVDDEAAPGDDQDDNQEDSESEASKLQTSLEKLLDEWRSSGRSGKLAFLRFAAEQTNLSFGKVGQICRGSRASLGEKYEAIPNAPPGAKKRNRSESSSTLQQQEDLPKKLFSKLNGRKNEDGSLSYLCQWSRAPRVAAQSHWLMLEEMMEMFDSSQVKDKVEEYDEVFAEEHRAEGERMFIVEGVRDNRINSVTHDDEYLIKWKGYPDVFNTWQTESDMGEDAEKFITAFQEASERL